jgi:hypothetical protein
MKNLLARRNERNPNKRLTSAKIAYEKLKSFHTSAA